MDLTTKIFSILPQSEELTFAKELLRMVSHYSQSFLKHRSQKYLVKVAKAKWEVKKKLENSSKSERNVCFKLFAVKFRDNTSRKVLGILFAFNFLSEYEQFKKSYLTNILRQIIPGISLIDESFCSCIDEKNRQLVGYCEVEKLKGGKLNLKEGIKLKKVLKEEIANGIQFCPPNAFFPENEETTLKNILQLHRELTSSKDLPQVHISFKDQQVNVIRFTVIIVRVFKKKERPLKKKLSNLDTEVSIALERQDPFLKKRTKETVVLSWNVANSLFYRKDHSMDILKARQHICMLLEQTIGEFRDYNGGLLLKQTEKFNSLIGSISNKITDQSDFEKLFYSLSPCSNQLLISNRVALDFYQLFVEIRKAPLEDGCKISFLESENASITIVKTRSPIYDSIFSNLSKEISLAKTTLNIHGEIFHCLIEFNTSNLSKSVHNNVVKLEKKKASYRKNELRIAFQHPILSFHPHLSPDIRSLTLYKVIFEGLTRISPEGMIEFALAESVRISDCKKIYHFKLRPSKWSNGESVTSYDFAKSWRRAIASQSSSVRSKDFFIIKNAKLAHQNLISLEEVGIITPSETEVIVELEHPAPYFLQLVADPAFSPLYQEDLNNEPTIFNGPFLPSSYKLDEKIKLTSNPLYWDKKSVHIRKLTVEIIEDSYKAYKKYKKGNLDLLASPFHSLPERVIKDSAVHFCKTYDPFLLFCNTKNPKLKSKKIRKALSLSIDRKQLIEQILPSHKASYSIIPEDLSFLSVNDYYSKNDREKSIDLFSQGLKEIGFKRKDFFLNLSHSNSLEQKELSYFLKDIWEKTFHIKVNLIESSWNSHWNAFFNKDYEIGGFYYLTSYKSPFYFMSSFDYHHDYTNWKNKIYQKYLSLAKESASDKKRDYYLKRSEEILMEEMPVIPICNRTHALLSKENLKGLPSLAFTYLELKWSYFED